MSRERRIANVHQENARLLLEQHQLLGGRNGTLPYRRTWKRVGGMRHVGSIAFDPDGDGDFDLFIIVGDTCQASTYGNMSNTQTSSWKTMARVGSTFTAT